MIERLFPEEYSFGGAAYSAMAVQLTALRQTLRKLTCEICSRCGKMCFEETGIPGLCDLPIPYQHICPICKTKELIRIFKQKR